MKIMGLLTALIVTFAAIVAPASGTDLARDKTGDSYYSVAVKLALDGRVIMTPKAVVLSGRMARVELLGATEAYRLQIVVSPVIDHASDRAQVNLDLLDKSAGNWVLRTAPTLVLKLGQTASMQVPYDNAENAPHVVDLSVIVDRPSSKLLDKISTSVGKPTSCPAQSGALPNPFATPPTPGQPQCCHEACADGSGQTMTCCGAVSYCACGSCCSTGL
ncbi:MAG: hypothetical protein KGQ84_02915 [Proteobacteria bacterium]|jgi:hypothetical protein|nr:hypothetical protein [Pseudomonadota bacterium]